MAIFKNLASQKIAVYAHDTSADAAKTGDAANITAQISIDGAATAATNDTNPTELDATDAPGVYLFDMTQAETNGDLIILSAVSSTSDISIEPVIIYTLPTWANSQVAQTGDSFAGQADIPADVWANSTRTLTQSAASVTATVTGSTISVKRGDSWSIALTGLGSIAGRTSLWFTVKSSYSDADTAAIVQIEETEQLIYINSAAAGTAANGTITVNDENDGNITITLDESESKNLSQISGAYYDVQVLNGGDVTTLTEGTFTITADITRAVS